MDPTNLDEVLAKALADHVAGAQAKGDRITLGIGGIEGVCWAKETHAGEGLSITELHVGLHGGVLGDAWVDNTWAGFGETTAESIVTGVHHWVDGPFEALASAFGAGSVEPVEREIAGRRGRVFASPWNVRGPAGTADAIGAAIGGSLIDRILAGGALPLVEPGRPLIVSTFVARYGDEATIEVKLDGVDWPLAVPALLALPIPRADAFISVRELAVVWPWPETGPIEPLSRGDLARTLAGLSAADPGHQRFGADHHRYALAPPLSAEALARLEAQASLPEDYRRFVAGIGAGGAGPFYGLLPPDNDAQRALLAGSFPYTEAWMPAHEGDAPEIHGVLALAHMGCGYVALLVVDGPARGEVWADLRAADRGLVRTHPSFTAWYLDWLFALVANRPTPSPTDASRCAFPRALSQYLTEDRKRRGLPPDSSDIGPSIAALPPRAIATVADNPRYFAPGQQVDLCPSCVSLARRLGIAPDRFVPGTPPKQAGASTDHGHSEAV